MVSFTLEATASLSISPVPEGEQVRVKSSIYLGGRLLTCPADVRFEEQEKCPLGTEMWEAVEEEMDGEEGKGGSSRKGDKAGEKRDRERDEV